MYVRMARFEGGDLHDVLAELDLIRADIETVRRGESSEYLPADLARVTDRIEVMVNREKSAAALLVYCDTIQQAGEADRILASMQPRHHGWGTRVSADIYEIAIDESPRAQRAA